MIGFRVTVRGRVRVRVWARWFYLLLPLGKIAITSIEVYIQANFSGLKFSIVVWVVIKVRIRIKN